MSVTNLNRGEKAISKTLEDKRRHLGPRALTLLGLGSLVFAALPKLDLVVSRFFGCPSLVSIPKAPPEIFQPSARPSRIADRYVMQQLSTPFGGRTVQISS
jgi:hypothetical protein